MSRIRQCGPVWFLLAFIVFLVMMFAQAVGTRGNPTGWHDSTNNPPVVWPATNSPLITSSNQLVDITYGLYSQRTNCIYRNWYYLDLTNYFQVVTNGDNSLSTNALGGPVAQLIWPYDYWRRFPPANATYGSLTNVTNFIGVTICDGSAPTNENLICVRNAITLDCLTNLNADGWIPFKTNQWIRDVIFSENSLETLRWALLKGHDLTSGSITQFWYQRSDPAGFVSYFGLQQYNPIGLYVPHKSIPSGSTNFLATDSDLQSPFVAYAAGSLATNPAWAFSYEETNALLNTTDLRLYDVCFANSERAQVTSPRGSAFFWDIYWANDWRIEAGSPAAPWNQPITNFYGAYEAVSRFIDHDHFRLDFLKEEFLAAGNTVNAGLGLPGNWVVRELSTGNFNDYCSTPTNVWIWTTSPSNHWVSSGAYPAIPLWSERAFWTNIDDIIGLPSGWLIVTTTNVVIHPGWAVGSNYIQFVTNNNVDVASSNRYGRYLNYTPRRYYTPAFPGNGHLVTNSWDLENVWGTVTNPFSSTMIPFDDGDPYIGGQWLSASTVPKSNQVFYLGSTLSDCITNPLRMNGHSFAQFPDHQVRDYIFETIQLHGGLCLTTNGTKVLTNPCAIALSVIHRQMQTPNGSPPYRTNDETLFSCILSNALNSTNASFVVTNYDVAEGFHDIDYDADGLKKIFNSLTCQVYSLTPYNADASQNGRWALSNMVAVTNLGTWITTATTNTFTGGGSPVYPFLVALPNQAVRMSSILLYPETCLNFASVRDIYVHSWNPGVLSNQFSHPTLRFDKTNNLGFWQYIETQGSEMDSNVWTGTFVANGFPALPGSGTNGWGIDGAVVVIKWDADPTNGFRFHR